MRVLVYTKQCKKYILIQNGLKKPSFYTTLPTRSADSDTQNISQHLSVYKSIVEIHFSNAPEQFSRFKISPLSAAMHNSAIKVPQPVADYRNESVHKQSFQTEACKVYGGSKKLEADSKRSRLGFAWSFSTVLI